MGEADKTVREVPCAPGMSALLPTGTLIHLRNCTVTGQVTYTPQTPGLEELSVFQENLPFNMTGVWFAVGVQQNSRRRGGWMIMDQVSNIRKKELAAPDARIGDFLMSRDVNWLVPGNTVYNLKTAPDYEYEDTGWFGSSPGHLSSKNVEANNGFLEAKDTKIDFAVGDAKQVSVLASIDTNRTLVSWKSTRFPKGSGGAQLNQIVRGSESADRMIRATEGTYTSAKWWARILDGLLIWYGTWNIAYTPYCCLAWHWLCAGISCKFQVAQQIADEHRGVIMGSMLRSVMWAIIPLLSAFGLTQLGFRFPVAFLIVGSCLFLVAVFVTICIACKRKNYDSFSDDSGEEVSSDDERHAVGSAGFTESLYILGLVTSSGLTLPLVISAYFYARGYA